MTKQYIRNPTKTKNCCRQTLEKRWQTQKLERSNQPRCLSGIEKLVIKIDSLSCRDKSFENSENQYIVIFITYLAILRISCLLTLTILYYRSKILVHHTQSAHFFAMSLEQFSVKQFCLHHLFFLFCFRLVSVYILIFCLFSSIFR